MVKDCLERFADELEECGADEYCLMLAALELSVCLALAAGQGGPSVAIGQRALSAARAAVEKRAGKGRQVKKVAERIRAAARKLPDRS